MIREANDLLTTLSQVTLRQLKISLGRAAPAAKLFGVISPLHKADRVSQDKYMNP